MPVSVGIFTAQVLQDAHLTDIRAHRKQSTPTGAEAAEICRNAFATPRVSKRRSAGAAGPNDSAHQGGCERHSGRLLVHAEMRMARGAAIARAVHTEDAHMPARFHDTSHTAFCHRAQSEADVD